MSASFMECLRVTGPHESLWWSRIAYFLFNSNRKPLNLGSSCDKLVRGAMFVCGMLRQSELKFKTYTKIACLGDG